MDEDTAEVIEQAEAPELDNPALVDDQQSEQSEGSAAAPEEIEIEIDGVLQKVPAHLKDAILRHADYTRKTTEVAERARALEQYERQVQAERALTQHERAAIDFLAQERAIDARITQYNQTDWNAWVRQDPVAAQAAFMELSQLKDAKKLVTEKREAQERQAEYTHQQRLAEAKAAGLKQLEKAIPNWGPTVAQEIAQHAQKLGFSEQEIGSIYNPKLVRLLYNSLQYDKQQAKATQIKPAAQVKTGGTSGSIDPDKLSPEEWLKWREKSRKTR
jgi:hypothetical protein